MGGKGSGSNRRKGAPRLPGAGRPRTAVEPLSPYAISRIIAEANERLEASPVKPVYISTARKMVAALESLKAQVAQLQAENAALREYEAIYAHIAAQWNAVCDAAATLGIECSMPIGSDVWHWRRGERSGTAVTSGEALAAALLEVTGEKNNG